MCELKRRQRKNSKPKTYENAKGFCMKHTYEDYFNAAKEIFQSDALKEYQGYFELNGEIIFGPRCGYTILQYDNEFLFIPYKLELDSNGRIRPMLKDSDETAVLIESFRKIKAPSLALFKKECYKYLKQIKEIQNKLRELKIQQDFQ